MNRKKIRETNIKGLPFIPDQIELDWLASYTDSKDPLYSVVFGYQMIDIILRALIYKSTCNDDLAGQRGMDRIVKSFKKCYPSEDSLLEEIYEWKDKRESIVHSLLFDNKITDEEKLDSFIMETSELGKSIAERLKLKLKEN
jgi:hypothetical protein